jgi:hypothetical protein
VFQKVKPEVLAKCGLERALMCKPTIKVLMEYLENKSGREE